MERENLEEREMPIFNIFENMMGNAACACVKQMLHFTQ